MPILNYTTTIAADRTASEIMGLLARKGAKSITMLYDDEADLTGISFLMLVAGMPVNFQLPANAVGVERCMLQDAKGKRGAVSQERQKQVRAQAGRTAWRILKDWVEAQIALVESQQAEMAQVFLPYVKGSDNRTMYEHFFEQQVENRRLTSGQAA